jgi:hypothetical protein
MYCAWYERSKLLEPGGEIIITSSWATPAGLWTHCHRRSHCHSVTLTVSLSPTLWHSHCDCQLTVIVDLTDEQLVQSEAEHEQHGRQQEVVHRLDDDTGEVDLVREGLGF